MNMPMTAPSPTIPDVVGLAAALALKADAAGVSNSLAGVSATLATKANASDLAAGLALKVDASTYTAGLATKAAVVHTHVISDTTGLQAALDAKANKSAFISIGVLPAHGIVSASNNAATNAPTNLNVVTTLLGDLTGQVNATNQKQNDLAAKYNDLANKFNALLLWDNSTTTTINGLRSAGGGL